MKRLTCLEGISDRRLICLILCSLGREPRKRRRNVFLSSVRNHENFRLLRFVSICPDPHRNDGTAWSLCHWQLDSLHYSRRVTDFSFPRKFPYSRLWQEIFPPSTSRSFSVFAFLRSFSRPRSRSRGAAFLSTEHGRRRIRYRLSTVPWFQALRQISFSLNHRRWKNLARSGYSFAVYKSSSSIGESFRTHSRLSRISTLTVTFLFSS